MNASRAWTDHQGWVRRVSAYHAYTDHYLSCDLCGEMNLHTGSAEKPCPDHDCWVQVFCAEGLRLRDEWQRTKRAAA